MKNSSKKHLTCLVLFLLWVLVVLVDYYRYHKPLDPALLAPPFGAALDILCAFIILLIAGGVGRRMLPIAAISPLERFTLQSAVGMGVMSIVWLILGSFHLYYGWMPLVMLVGLFNWKASLAWLQECSILKNLWQHSRLLDKTLGCFSFLLVGIQLLLALCPPTRWDTLSYHLQLPRIYLAQKSIQMVPDNLYWGHSQVGEMLYTWAYSFFRAETASVLCWMAGIIVLIGIFGFTLQHNPVHPSLNAGENLQNASSLTAAWMAVAALLCGYTFRYMLSWAYTDIFAVLMGLGVFITLFAWMDSGKKHWLLWMGAMIGFSMGVKLTSGVIALPVYLAVLLNWKKVMFSAQSAAGETEGKQGTVLKMVILSGLVALLVVMPWFLKNWVSTGNPLFPYGFPTQWTSPLRLSIATEVHSSTDWLEQFFFPFTVATHGIENAPPFNADLGPLMILFALPALWIFRKNPKIQVTMFSLVVMWICISLVGAVVLHLRQTRLYFVLLPCFALACGCGWSYLQSLNLSGVRLRRFAGSAVLLVMALVLFQDITATTRSNPLGLVMGTQSQEQYLDGTLGWYAPAMRALNALPPDSKTIMLWEPRGFYAPLSATPDPWIDRWILDSRTLGTPQAILKSWQEKGYTHLLIFKSGADFIRDEPGAATADDWNKLDSLLAQLPEPLSFGDVYQLYPLQP